jgi:hypothetical protein
VSVLWVSLTLSMEVGGGRCLEIVYLDFINCTFYCRPSQPHAGTSLEYYGACAGSEGHPDHWLSQESGRDMSYSPLALLNQ